MRFPDLRSFLIKGISFNQFQVHKADGVFLRLSPHLVSHAFSDQVVNERRRFMQDKCRLFCVRLLLSVLKNKNIKTLFFSYSDIQYIDASSLNAKSRMAS